MPLVVPPASYGRWLDPGAPGREVLAELLAEPGEDPFVLHPVDRRVNDVREDDARLLEPERDLFSPGSPP
jgi:putative SOS response-associated peptidase YedK